MVGLYLLLMVRPSIVTILIIYHTSNGQLLGKDWAKGWATIWFGHSFKLIYNFNISNFGFLPPYWQTFMLI